MAHIPVLLNEVIDLLDSKRGETIVDCTFGGGGHTKAILNKVEGDAKIIAIDADPSAISEGRKYFAEVEDMTFVNRNFRDLAEILDELQVKKVDKFLFDLGFSTNQLESSGRGFSFKNNEPLLMTLSEPQEGEKTAYEIVNYYSENDLEKIIREFGEERFSRRVARGIVAARENKKIETTLELERIINNSIPGAYERGRINKATRTFQAIRIAVNDELGGVVKALPEAFERLTRGGRIAVISFHSLEDRIVKNYFRDMAKGEKGILITKKPVTATEAEVRENPKSRSAKLRVIEKI